MLSGFHFTATSDSVYVVQGLECLRLDPVTGNETARFRLPKDDEFGTIRIQDNVMVVEAFRNVEKFGKRPASVVALDRKTGKMLWSQEASQSFPVMAIGHDKVYCFDAEIEGLAQAWKRRGLVPKASDIRQLKAFDLKTGKPIWERTTDQVVTWLAYSAEQDVLVASNQKGISARTGKNGTELWDKSATGVGFKGHPEALVDKLILWKDRILDQRGPGFSYDLKTGAVIQRDHPLTDEKVNWEFTKTGHHCNYAIANPHMLTFRDSAGFCDISTGTTSRLEGYRSGCRNSLIPANGVLNSPNFASGCVCGYSLFTSLALVHVPQNEVWSYNALKTGKESIRRIGVNFGAKGDRVAPNGTLWLEHPNVTGTP